MTALNLQACLGLVGYGEVGKIFAAGLKARFGAVFAWDLKFDLPLIRDVERSHAERAGIVAAESMAHLCQDASLVISAVTASNTLAVAQAAAACIRPGTVFLDLNSASPGTKQQAAALIDAAGRTGADNPLTNLKVRQAIFHAIDRPTIARTLIPGGARVPDGPCYPTQFGCDAAAALRYDYDPDKARALLLDAGYPNGFPTEMVSYVQPAITAAIQGYLKAVGIDADVRQLQTATAIQRSQEGRNPLDLGTWGSYSVNDVSAILPNFFTFTTADYARDPELKTLIEQGGNNVEPDTRRKFYSAAIKRITEKAYWLPLHTYVTTYVYRRGLAFKPFPDEMPRFYTSSWK